MRITIRAPDAREARSTQERLVAAGLDADIGRGATREGEADVLVVAGRGNRANDLARRAAAQTRRPLAIIGASETRRPPRPSLKDGGPIDGWIALDAPDDLIARQIKSMIRTAVADDELRLRRATAEEMGVEGRVTLPSRRLKALYIGAPSPFFLAMERRFAAHRGQVTAAFSSFSGFDHLHDESFDAVALNGATDSATAVSLCAALRRNAGLHHLPTLVITRAGDRDTASAAIERGAAVIAAEGESSETAVAWLFDAIRQERRRYAIERQLHALCERMGDAATGLFNADAFQIHLARLADDHHTNGRPLSLLALRVLPAHGARKPSESAWRQSFREVAALASLLIRGADCCASLGRDLIVAALPATLLEGAQRAAERIASVVECTCFASGESESGPLIFEQSAAELNAGESGQKLLERALARFATQGAAA